MLTTKLPLAIAPAARRNHAAKALVDAARIQRDSGAETAPQNANARGIYIRMAR